MPVKGVHVTPPPPHPSPSFLTSYFSNKKYTCTEFVQKESGGPEVVFLSMFSALITLTLKDTSALFLFLLFISI
jgi:hypothetical protein